MTRNIDPHVALVRQWLEVHVLRVAAVNHVKLHSFNSDWREMRGSFKVDFDGVPCSMEFEYEVGKSDGYTSVSCPRFTSPLGAPATYPAVEMSDAAWNAIDRGIKTLFPRVTPLGMLKSNGEVVDVRTPIADRIIDTQTLSTTRTKMSDPSFCIEVEIQNRP